jgi:transposase
VRASVKNELRCERPDKNIERHVLWQWAPAERSTAMKLSIGIDWSDQSHALCVRELDTRRILAEFVIEHSVTGMAQLETVREVLGSPAEECAVAIETNQGIVVNYLLGAGYRVHPIPPAAVIPYRDRRRRTGAKSDQDDARLLADILCQDRDLHPPLANDSPLARELQATYRGREQLVRHRTQVINQAKQNLKTYFPHAVGLFSSLDTQIARAFLKTYPTHEAAEQASDAELRAFFQAQHYTRPNLIPDKIAQLRTPCIPVPAWQVRAGQLLTAALLEQLEALSQCIQLHEQCLEQLLEQHPDAALFRSLPRVGPVLAAGFIGELGDCREKFVDASALQALAGTAPVTIQSGPTQKARFRFACNKPLRYVLQQFARQSAHPNGSVWARGYVSNQLERGHSKSRAYRALANRWLVIIFRMWQDHSLYNEDYHLRNIAQRGIRLSVSASKQVPITAGG